MFYSDKPIGENKDNGAKFEIFKEIGGLRKNLEGSCHDQSKKALMKLKEKGYDTSSYYYAIWEDVDGPFDHVCTLVNVDGKSLCVDVTIGQFPELNDVVADPSPEGMVFIGSREKWEKLLKEMMKTQEIEFGEVTNLEDVKSKMRNYAFQFFKKRQELSASSNINSASSSKKSVRRSGCTLF